MLYFVYPFGSSFFHVGTMSPFSHPRRHRQQKEEAHKNPQIPLHTFATTLQRNVI